MAENAYICIQSTHFRMDKRLLFLAVFAAALVSCRQAPVIRRDTIPFVKQMAEDSTGILHLLSSYREDGTAGSIAILGEPGPVLSLSERFLTVDAVDNIDGHKAQDRLPDFSGETFDVLLDMYNAPYDRYLPHQPDSLREIAVRNAIFAADSLCLSNAALPSSRLHKSRAKVLVLASSLLSAYGAFDIDTLFKMAGKTPILLTPVETMLSEALSSGPAQIGVWAGGEAAEAYKACFEALPHEGSSLTVLQPEATMDARRALRDFLRRYHDAGNRRIDCLLLDGFDQDLFQLQAEISHIRLSVTEEDNVLNQLISSRFRLIEPKEALTDACYRVLRKENLFTHAIAYPKASYYETEEAEDGNYVLVALSRQFLSERWNSYADLTYPEMPYVPDND